MTHFRFRLPSYFLDSKGKQTIIQFPNLPLILFFIVSGGARFVGTSWQTPAHVVAMILLAIWAAMEFVKGDSEFRRTAGIIGLLYVATTLLPR